MKFKKVLLPALLLIGIILLTQCNDECEMHDLGLLLLEDSDFGMNPYTEGSTIVLIDSLNDTLRADFKFRESDFDWRHYESMVPAEFRICSDYYYVERNSTRLESADSSFDVGMSIYTSNPFRLDPAPKMMYFGLSLPVNDSTNLQFDGHYDITGGYFSDPPDYLQFNSRVVTLHSNLNLGGHTYIHVYELTEHTTGDRFHPISGGITTIYYSVDEGLLGFVTKEGHRYYRP